jgi:hypothetical protein
VSASLENAIDHHSRQANSRPSPRISNGFDGYGLTSGIAS